MRSEAPVNKVGFSNAWYRLITALIIYLVLLKTHHTRLEQIHKSKLILYNMDLSEKLRHCMLEITWFEHHNVFMPIMAIWSNSCSTVIKKKLYKCMKCLFKSESDEDQ